VSYADNRVATSRVSHTIGVKCNDPDKKGYPVPPGWWEGVGRDVRLTTLPP